MEKQKKQKPPRIKKSGEIVLERLKNGLRAKIEGDEIYFVEWLENNRGSKSRIRVGDYMGPTYEWILNPVIISSKIAYVAGTKDRKMVVNYDGQEGPRYELIGDLRNLAGKLFYIATKKRETFVNFDGREIPLKEFYFSASGENRNS